MDEDGFLDELLSNEITPPRLGWGDQRKQATPAPSSWRMSVSMDMDDDYKEPPKRTVRWDAPTEDDDDKNFDVTVEKDLDDLFGPQVKEEEPEPERPSAPVPESELEEEPVIVQEEPVKEPEPEPEPVKQEEPEPEPVKQETEEPEPVKPKPASLKLKRRGRDRVKTKQPVSNGCTCGGSGTCDECVGGL